MNQLSKLFDEQIARKPDKYPWTRDFIDAMWKGHWTPNEFSFVSDIHDFKVNLTAQEQEIIKKTISTISQVEVAVKRFWSQLGDNLPHPSITDLGFVMAHVEVIHNCAYEKLLHVLGLEDIFEENLKIDVLQNRVKYLHKHTHKYYKDSKKQYIYALILFTVFVENISLFSQFYIVNWFARYKNVLKDTAQQIRYTASEELLHFLAGAKIVNTLRIEYPELFDEELEEKIYQEVREAFKSESKIIDWIIGEYEFKGLNDITLKEFLKHRFNDSLRQIGFKPQFEIDIEIMQDTEWFNDETLSNINTDFFYTRPTGYTKGLEFNEDEIF
ncbi:MAG TPA: ribonucleotide-diphosphate reductase subunit beta [Aquella sp.]|nr:ribonucleotide-diphosphate reductase subunit beta [Aquella sp.]